MNSMNKDWGAGWISTQQYSTSADAQAGLDITAAPTAATEYICLDDLLISSDTSLTLSLRSKTTGTVFAKLYVPANTPVQITFRNGLVCPTINKAVQIVASGAGNVAVTASYHSMTPLTKPTVT